MESVDNQGVPASPSGCQPSASAADASSRSGIPNAEHLVLAEELRGLAIEMHRRCYRHVPNWKPSGSARGLLSQIDNMVAGMRDDIERLRTALSWIEPPFVDDDTSDDELRRRVAFAVADAKRAQAMSTGTAKTAQQAEGRSPASAVAESDAPHD